MQETKIYYSKAKLILQGLLSIILFAMGVLSTLRGSGVLSKAGISIGLLAVGVFLCVFGLLGVFIAVKRFFISTPVLVIDHEGVKDFIGIQPVVYRWSNISDIQEHVVRGRRGRASKLIRINVKDMDEVVNQTTGKTKMLVQLTTQSYSYGSITTVMLKVRHKDLLELLKQYHEFYQSQETLHNTTHY